MTFDQLRIFVEVAEQGHLTRAANSLSLTPAAVSASIRALENRYGTQLFDRIGRGIELNQNGHIFLIEAKAALSKAQSAELTLSELGNLMRGNLSIHASQTIASYWLPPILLQYTKAHPLIDIQLTIGNTDHVAMAVLKGSADVGFIEGKIEDENLQAEIVDGDDIVLVVSPNHPWTRRKRIDPQDLLGSKWILREIGSGTRAAFMAMLLENGVDPDALDIELTLPSNEAVRSAVMAGSYASVLSALVVASDIKAGLLCRVKIDLPRRSFFLLRHKERYKTKAYLALEKILSK